MSEFLKELRERVKGEIRSDPISRHVYSVDASIYEVEPLAILQPLNAAEVEIAVKLAAQYAIPVTARGAATGITGGCLGSGLILDLSRHLNRILQIDLKAQTVLCEPGVIQDALNEALAPHGFRLGPDTSTGDRATLGGMLANNAAGARSLRFGSMVDHVHEVELVGADGKRVLMGKSAGPFTSALDKLWERYSDLLLPKLPRHVSGYHFEALRDKSYAKLIAGSEGTLGIATALKLQIVPKLPKTVLYLIPSTLTRMDQIEKLLALNPISLEMIDSHIIRLGRASPAFRGGLKWLEGTPEVLLIAEFETAQLLPGTLLTDPIAINELWSLRKAGLGLLLSRRSYSRAIAFIEDVSVPPHALPSFMEKFLTLLKSKGKEAGIYGHVGAGCLHIRPYIDLREPNELELMREMMLAVCDLVIEHGGVMSGEHGDGLVRSWLNERLFGKRMYEGFVALKEIFDPHYLFNPGKIVHGPPLEKNLRQAPRRKLETFLDFEREGGIELAADLCNGNGLCRKREKVMCPSFQATQDEYDTTRARAQALRSLIQGELEEIEDVLDLCLECKGCKRECPSQVDMAKMKAEMLYQSQKKRGIPLRSKLFGHIGNFFRAASPFASLVNYLSETRLAKALRGPLGITKQRPLPQLAKERFSTWMERHIGLKSERAVVLFNDTYTEFLEPGIGIAAVKVLEKLGYRVVVPPWQCCGRPLFSKGMLREAKEKAENLKVQEGLPIVVLEPSCLSMLTDDFIGLVGKKIEASLFDTFIARHSLPLKPLKKRILLHGHCHQKALEGVEDTLAVLRRIKEADVSEIPSGCCGMAGSFGYEEEHHLLSLKIGELSLFPAIRKSDAIVVANGLSCRTQIAHGTGCKALHLAELLAQLV